MSRHPCIWMGLGLSAVFGQAQAAWDVNMRSGATDVSRSVFDLHMTIFWICVVIGVLVFGVMMAFFPSGLVLYWVTNGGLGLLQQWLLIRKYADDKPSGGKPAKA